VTTFHVSPRILHCLPNVFISLYENTFMPFLLCASCTQSSHCPVEDPSSYPSV
jgi:ABC-type microcin C transport system permease subunit YejE